MPKVVVKIGGSVAIDENGPIRNYFKRLVPILKEVEKTNDLYVVIGGGKVARNYFRRMKGMVSNRKAEWVLIDILHANGRFLSFLLGAKFISKKNEIGKAPMVASGFEPGHSSDGTAAIIASKVGADALIIITDVKGIYDKNPKKHRNAKLIKRMSFEEAKKITMDGSPVNYGVVDKTALELIIKNKIKTFVVGKNPKNILKVLNGENPGTMIYSE